MPETLYLVLDQGGQSSRALIFNQHGESVAQARVNQTTDATSLNFDPKWVVESLRVAATEAVRQLPPTLRKQPIRAALICQRSSCLCWDRASGQPLTPLIGWQDNSGQTAIERLKLHHPEIQRLSGLVPNGHTPAAKWSQLLCSPAMISASQNYRLSCGSLASFLIFHLCREHPFLIDRVNAARTQLYSLDSRGWSPRLLNLFNIPYHYLPDIQPCDFRFGTLELAGQRIPLKLVSGDQSCALFTDGWPNPGAVSVNLGTGAFIQMPLQVPARERPRCPLLVGPAFSGEDELLVLEGTVNGCATALNLTSLPLGLNYATSTEWPERYEPLPLFINGVGGLGSPDWCTVESGWQSILPMTNHAKVLAVAESILFLIQRNLSAMRDVGIIPSSIRLSGGISQIDWLAQGLANLSQLPVHRLEDCEASARGAAWLLSRSSDWGNTPEHLFVPAPQSAIQQRYKHWTRLFHRSLRAGVRRI